MIDLFSGAGGIPLAGIVLLAAAVLVHALVRTLPAIIWSLRCPRDSRHYRCPPLSGDRSSVSGLLIRRRD